MKNKRQKGTGTPVDLLHLYDIFSKKCSKLMQDIMYTAFKRASFSAMVDN
jgi:hypothetical protein